MLFDQIFGTESNIRVYRSPVKQIRNIVSHSNTDGNANTVTVVPITTINNSSITQHLTYNDTVYDSSNTTIGALSVDNSVKQGLQRELQHADNAIQYVQNSFNTKLNNIIQQFITQLNDIQYKITKQSNNVDEVHNIAIDNTIDKDYAVSNTSMIYNRHVSNSTATLDCNTSCSSTVVPIHAAKPISVITPDNNNVHTTDKYEFNNDSWLVDNSNVSTFNNSVDLSLSYQASI